MIRRAPLHQAADSWINPRSARRTASSRFCLRLKGPKAERGKRTITIDPELIALLAAERERHVRIAAGVPDGATVDLSL